jgi:hypothetical protein
VIEMSWRLPPLCQNHTRSRPQTLARRPRREEGFGPAQEVEIVIYVLRSGAVVEVGRRSPGWPRSQDKRNERDVLSGLEHWFGTGVENLLPTPRSS